jgi:hypothetical protein
VTSLCASIIASFSSSVDLSVFKKNFITGSGQQGLESREIVKAQHCHSWSDIIVTKETNVLMYCHCFCSHHQIAFKVTAKLYNVAT